MDEEENFAKLLSQSTTAAIPSWSPADQEQDPWANPFSDAAPGLGSSNPFATSTPSFDTQTAYDPDPYTSSLAVPVEESVSPYVSKLEDEAQVQAQAREEEDQALGRRPDMPSVLAAREREQEETQTQAGYTDASHGQPPYSSFQNVMPPAGRAQQQGGLGGGVSEKRGLPSDLIDEDLLAASDPEASLKKAFVKSSPAKGKSEGRSNGTTGGQKAYVFTPGQGKGESKGESKSEPKLESKGDLQGMYKADAEEEVKVGSKPLPKEEVQPEKPEDSKAVTSELKTGSSDFTDTEKDTNSNSITAAGKEDTQAKELIAVEKNESSTIGQADTAGKQSDSNGSSAQGETDGETTPTKTPNSVPLPESTAATPTATRPASPTPAPQDPSEPSPSIPFTPSSDRVAVSPLDPLPQESDYGFQSLSIGGSSIAPPPPPKSSEPNTDGWGASQTSTPSGSRFSGKGWAAVDDEVEDGLFGKGGPSVRPSAPAASSTSDMWGSSADVDSGEGGWGEPGVASLSSPAPVAGPSHVETPSQSSTPPDSTTPVKSAGTPRTPKVLSKPLFQITVGDPTRVGDPVRGYTVYTVKTRTTSPHYRRGEFSVLRRFSDFLWLFETLTMNNPGVIVPPVPDKHPFGRFQDTFIETRRLALQRCLTKVTAHPVLQLDPDLRLFLESDHFATESKNRRAEAQQEAGNKGLLSSWTGPRFVEQDDWFDSRRAFLDSLESQLRALSKSLEAASKSRLDMALAIGDFASSVGALAESDLGSAMCSALARLNDLAIREKEGNEEQAKAEVVNLLNLADEYMRFIGSVRMAFAGRIKSYERWQMAEKEVGRLRSAREKMRQQGKLGERGPQTLAEVGEAERRSRDANGEFDAVSKLVKSEFGRFEKERVEEFKNTLERYLDGMILRQKDLIEAWEEYHAVVLKMVQKAQGGQGQQQQQGR